MSPTTEGGPRPISPVENIARRVADLRGRKRMTAQQLGDRLTELGVPWDRFTVANLERGKRRNVSVVELLALSAALDVAPVHLLVPLDDRPYEATPSWVLPADRVRAWVRGKKQLPGGDLRLFVTEVPMEELPKQSGTVRFAGRHGSAELNRLAEEGQAPRDEPPGEARGD